MTNILVKVKLEGISNFLEIDEIEDVIISKTEDLFIGHCEKDNLIIKQIGNTISVSNFLFNKTNIPDREYNFLFLELLNER